MFEWLLLVLEKTWVVSRCLSTSACHVISNVYASNQRLSNFGDEAAEKAKERRSEWLLKKRRIRSYLTCLIMGKSVNERTPMLLAKCSGLVILGKERANRAGRRCLGHTFKQP